MKTTITIVLLFMLSVTLKLTAQVWNLPENAFEVYVSYSNINYDAIYDSTGTVTDLDDYRIYDQTLQLSGAYGISNQWTVLLSVPYKLADKTDANSNEQQSTLNAFGNIEIGAIYQYLKNNPYLTASLKAELNTSDYNFINGLATGYNGWAIIPGLGYKSAYENLWTSMYVGAEFRANDFSNAILADIESGYTPAEFVYFAAHLFIRNSFNNGDYCDCTLQETAMYANDQSYFGAGFKTGFLYKSFGLNVGANISFTGKNMPAASAISLGISYKNF